MEANPVHENNLADESSEPLFSYCCRGRHPPVIGVFHGVTAALDRNAGGKRNLIQADINFDDDVAVEDVQGFLNSAEREARREGEFELRGCEKSTRS